MIEFDVTQFWNVVAVLAVVVTSGMYLRRLNQRAYIAVLRETGEGWKAAHDLKVSELNEIRERVTALEADLQRRQGQYQEVLQLNVVLQRDLRDRDRRIVELEAHVTALQEQVARLLGERKIEN